MSSFVIPAQAGISTKDKRFRTEEIPACAGMTFLVRSHEIVGAYAFHAGASEPELLLEALRVEGLVSYAPLCIPTRERGNEGTVVCQGESIAFPEQSQARVVDNVHGSLACLERQFEEIAAVELRFSSQ